MTEVDRPPDKPGSDLESLEGVTPNYGQQQVLRFSITHMGV
jgi:hypothetical protein